MTNKEAHIATIKTLALWGIIISGVALLLGFFPKVAAVILLIAVFSVLIAILYRAVYDEMHLTDFVDTKGAKK